MGVNVEFGVLVRHLLNDHDLTLDRIAEETDAVLLSWIDVWDSTAKGMKKLRKLHKNLDAEGGQ